MRARLWYLFQFRSTKLFTEAQFHYASVKKRYYSVGNPKSHWYTRYSGSRLSSGCRDERHFRNFVNNLVLPSGAPRQLQKKSEQNRFVFSSKEPAYINQRFLLWYFPIHFPYCRDNMVSLLFLDSLLWRFFQVRIPLNRDPVLICDQSCHFVVQSRFYMQRSNPEMGGNVEWESCDCHQGVPYGYVHSKDGASTQYSCQLRVSCDLNGSFALFHTDIQLANVLLLLLQALGSVHEHDW